MDGIYSEFVDLNRADRSVFAGVLLRQDPDDEEEEDEEDDKEDDDDDDDEDGNDGYSE